MLKWSFLHKIRKLLHCTLKGSSRGKLGGLLSNQRKYCFEQWSKTNKTGLKNISMVLREGCNDKIGWICSVMPWEDIEAICETHSLAESLTHSYNRLDWCDPGEWRYQLKRKLFCQVWSPSDNTIQSERANSWIMECEEFILPDWSPPDDPASVLAAA